MTQLLEDGAAKIGICVDAEERLCIDINDGAVILKIGNAMRFITACLSEINKKEEELSSEKIPNETFGLSVDGFELK